MTDKPDTMPPLPVWLLRDDLGNLVPSDMRASVRAYASQHAEERCAPLVEALDKIAHSPNSLAETAGDVLLRLRAIAATALAAYKAKQ